MFYSNKSVLLTSTYESMHKHIIQSSVTNQTTQNSMHIYTSTTKHTIVNAMMSTKSTHNALQTSFVKCPIQAMSVQITLENSVIGQSFYAIFGSNPPQIAIVMKHAFFNVKFSGE